MTHTPFPSICQLRQVMRDIKAPTTFTGTVKLHGTNGGIVFDRRNGSWVQSYQSRNHVLDPQGLDNHGFRATQSANPVWPLYVHALAVPAGVSRVVVYGEWCGPKINSGVGVVELEHFFYVFAVRFDDAWQRVPAWTWPHSSRVFCIWDFPTYKVVIDPAFADQHELETTLETLTLAVERKCPAAAWIAERDGVTLQCATGEGIVWTAWPLRFKTKGAEHQKGAKPFSARIVRYGADEMTALLNAIVPEWRLEQMADGDWSIANIGAFIHRVSTDIDKEESDTVAQFLKDNPKSTRKDIMRGVSKRAVAFYKRPR